MEDAIRHTFNCLDYFIEDELCCYVTPIDKPDKIMAQFPTSYEMIRFLRQKEFVYNSATYEWTKNGRRYVLWSV